MINILQHKPPSKASFSPVQYQVIWNIAYLADKGTYTSDKNIHVEVLSVCVFFF